VAHAPWVAWLELKFSLRAKRHIRDAAIWWRTNRLAAPDLFDEELLHALEMIELFPDAVERARTRRFPNARVKTLPETGHLLIYRRETKSRVNILALLVSRKTQVRP
jgi:plasmid stabilization system protein ParE